MCWNAAIRAWILLLKNLSKLLVLKVGGKSNLNNKISQLLISTCKRSPYRITHPLRISLSTTSATHWTPRISLKGRESKRERNINRFKMSSRWRRKMKLLLRKCWRREGLRTCYHVSGKMWNLLLNKWSKPLQLLDFSPILRTRPSILTLLSSKIGQRLWSTQCQSTSRKNQEPLASKMEAARLNWNLTPFSSNPQS